MTTPDEQSPSIDSVRDELRPADATASDHEPGGLSRRAIVLRRQPVIVERILSRRFERGQVDAPTITPSSARAQDVRQKNIPE
jgi:hypothetical protein